MNFSAVPLKRLVAKPPVYVFMVAGVAAAAIYVRSGGDRIPMATSEADEAVQSDAAPVGQTVHVETVAPTRGGLERLTTQPGSLYAFEAAELFSRVSGFLEKQTVDIGDKVKRGQVVAEILAPELDIEVNQADAALAQANADVQQMHARVNTAQAKWQSAKAGVAQAEAELERAAAQRSYQQKQYQRIKDLYDLNSVDGKLVDEKLKEMQAAQAAERAAQAAVATANADVAAAAAKVEEAKADIVDAEAKAKVAQAALDKATVFAGFKKIVSPYDGVVTKRNFDRGDFIRAAERGEDTPLLRIERTDLMRMVVQVPDRDVPLAVPGSPATIEIDALPGETFTGKVARVASAEDSQSRTMRVEIDLPNPTGRLRHGMYGRVSIKLCPPTNAWSVPASSLAGPLKDGKSSIYVVREGNACLVPVKVAADDGLRVEISDGLRASDEVICRYNGAIGDHVPVTVAGKADR